MFISAVMLSMVPNESFKVSNFPDQVMGFISSWSCFRNFLSLATVSVSLFIRGNQKSPMWKGKKKFFLNFFLFFLLRCCL